MNRQEHLDWCKQRALEYLDNGDWHGGLASMLSDIRKHPETQDHPAVPLAAILMFSGQLNDVKSVRDFILGFN